MDRQFPPEIVQLVAEASLDPYDPLFFTSVESRQRYSVLKNYCVLNSTWRAVSEPLLFNISRVLRFTPCVINLVLDVGMVDIDDLAQLPQLRRLQMSDVEIRGSPSSSTLCFPSLRSIQLYDSRVTTSAAHFLRPHFLPQLRHLELCEGDDLIQVEPLLPQLEALSLGLFTDHLLSTAQSLRLLQLSPLAYTRIEDLSELPSIPPFLLIDSKEAYVGRVRQKNEDAMKELLSSTKAGLRVVFLGSREGEEVFDHYGERFATHGIRLIQPENRLRFDEAIVKMEEILAEEKRAEEKVEKKRK